MSRKLRVTWVIGAIGHGGVITVCQNVTEALAADPLLDVTLLAVHDRAPSFALSEQRVGLVVLGLPRDDWEASAGLLKWLEGNPQDVVFMNDAFHVEPAWPFIPPPTLLVPVLHDVARGWRRGIVEHREAWDGVVTVSGFVREVLIADIPDRARDVRVVLNGIAPLRKEPDRTGHPPAIRLLFAGGQDPFKGFSDLPRILDRLESQSVPYTLTVLGDVHPSDRRWSRRRGRAEKVRFTGHMPHNQCLETMGEHDVLLMLSRSEPFGMVTVEAMAMGCIPVAYDMPSGTREIVQSGRTGFLVKTGSVRHVAEIITRLHRDAGLCTRVSRETARVARSVFSAERMAKDYRQVVNEILAARVPRPRQTFDPAHLKPRRPAWWVRHLAPGMRLALRRWIGRSPHMARHARLWRG